MLKVLNLSDILDCYEMNASRQSNENRPPQLSRLQSSIRVTQPSISMSGPPLRDINVNRIGRISQREPLHTSSMRTPLNNNARTGWLLQNLPSMAPKEPQEEVPLVKLHSNGSIVHLMRMQDAVSRAETATQVNSPSPFNCAISQGHSAEN